jgi:pimeloyl-ACP methyl ester carboxylesterase
MLGPSRVQFQRKDPRGWDESKRWLAEHSATGSALTLRGVQIRRPSLYDLTDHLRGLEVPVLLVTGDEDEGCLDPNLMLKRTIPTAALAVLPRTGHACNLEEPALFNRLVLDFVAAVEAGRWEPRDPRSLGASLTGMER